MKRKYLKDLERWLSSPRRKPLLIYGARQIGKTYLVVELFAKKYFPNKYVYVDCKLDKQLQNVCSHSVDPLKIIQHLENKTKIKITDKTLLIFDEVQDCLPIITSLKYFNQNHPTIPVIVTGSMVRMKLQRDSHKPGPKTTPLLFPVGKIQSLQMFPLNFEEFLMNYNETLLETITNAYHKMIPLDASIHNLALDAFYNYLLIGGMPEVVQTFLNNKNYLDSINIINDIFENYLNDMGQFQTSTETVIRTKQIFNSIFTQLNKEQKNFKCSLINPNLRHRDLFNAINWLELTNIVFKSNQIKEKAFIPLIQNNESLYRLYLCDMGLFTYQSKLDTNTFLETSSQNKLSGIFFENYVAIEMINAGLNLFYWRGKATSEFEFITQYNNSIIPIEVKKGHGKITSLLEFKKHNRCDLVIKISKNNYGFNSSQQKILTIPYYWAFLLFHDIANHTLQIINKYQKK